MSTLPNPLQNQSDSPCVRVQETEAWRLNQTQGEHLNPCRSDLNLTFKQPGALPSAVDSLGCLKGWLATALGQLYSGKTIEGSMASAHGESPGELALCFREVGLKSNRLQHGSATQHR